MSNELHIKADDVHEFHYSVFIGKFGPVHGFIANQDDDFESDINGHVKVIMEALQRSDYLIVVVGSNNISRNTRIPFTAAERITMLKIATSYNPRILYVSVGDHPYNDPRWIAGIQDGVDEVIKAHERTAPIYTVKGWTDYKHKIALAGMFKDQTSFYLNWFPQWSSSIAVLPGTEGGDIISSTGIRNKIFNGELAYEKHIHPEIRDYILQHMEHYPELWARLQSDWNYEQKYEAQWGKGPHVTVDSVVIQAGHVLLIQRGNEYGHGLWALPGGFLNKRERIKNGSVRELVEETMLHLPEKVLFGSLKESKFYDEPYRSNRSHIITFCHLYVLNNVDNGLPEVYGSDDADKAEWVPISELKNMTNDFFEDHYFILEDLLKL